MCQVIAINICVVTNVHHNKYRSLYTGRDMTGDYAINVVSPDVKFLDKNNYSVQVRVCISAVQLCHICIL